MVQRHRCTEIGEAPGWQGATTENIGNIWEKSNAASRDASPIECGWSRIADC
jgi:hypothetical protein